ncbi:MAG TPA: DUF998 domain-containing protein [Longimicrobiales bacterium]|nr:DUF998 domain-containing protein [Longimicrobiales bacterium]
MKSLLYLLLAAPLLRPVVVYGAGALTPGYSHRRDFLSELSAIGAPHQGIVSLFGPGLTGVALCLAVPVLWRSWSESRVALAATALLAVSGVAYLGIAAAPCDPGCSRAVMGPRMTIHLVSGVVAMGALVAGGFIFGLALIRSRPWLGRLALASGLVGSLTYLYFLGAATTSPVPGLIQRVVQHAGDICIVAVALATLGRPVKPAGDAAGVEDEPPRSR